MYKSEMEEIIDRESIDPKIVLILVILGLFWLITLTAIIVIFFLCLWKKGKKRWVKGKGGRVTSIYDKLDKRRNLMASAEL